jgi:hypothetical protein
LPNGKSLLLRSHRVLHGYCVLHGHRLLHGYCVLHGHRLLLVLIGPPTTFAAQHDGDTDADGNDSDPTNHGADDDARWVAPFDWIVAVRIVAVRIVAVGSVAVGRVAVKELTPFVMHI